MFKSIYSNYYIRCGKKHPLPNGLHPKLLNFLKENLENNVKSNIEDYETSRFPFNHGDFQHYFYNLYGDEGIVFLDEIENNLEENMIYVFPLEIKTTLESIRSDLTCAFNEKTYTYNAISSLPQEVIRLLQTKQIYLLLTLIHDPVFEEDVLNTTNSLKKYGIESDRLHIISASGIKVKNSNVSVHRGIIPLTKLAYDLDDRPSIRSLGYLSEYVNIDDLNENIIRNKKFLSFNRTARSHRICLFYLAVRYNWLDTGLFSFIFPDKNELHFENSIVSLLPTETEFNTVLPNIIKNLPYELDTQHLLENEKGGFVTNNNKKEFYLDSYINIVTETSFFESDVCYTEKIFRPMANLQPFILLGNPLSLNGLREMGFKTFHPFINETYDTLIDPIQRIESIKQEIIRLNNMDMKELHELYYSMKDILVHNRKHLSRYKNYNPFHIPLENMKRTIQRGYYGISR